MEFVGKTVDEAIELALKELGAKKEELKNLKAAIEAAIEAAKEAAKKTTGKLPKKPTMRPPKKRKKADKNAGAGKLFLKQYSRPAFFTENTLIS